MPARRPTPSRSAVRAKTVPIRVVKSVRRNDVTSPTPRVLGRKQGVRPTADRRMLMWTSVTAVSLAIFIFWLFFLRTNLSRPVPSDTFLEKIKNEFSVWLAKLRPFPATPQNDNANSELDELRSKVFPDIGDQKFRTTNEGNNVNGSE